MGKREIAGRLRAGMSGPYNSVSQSVGADSISARAASGAAVGAGLCSARTTYPQ